MSVSGNEFIYFKMESEYYKDLEQGMRDHLDIYKIEVENIDYSFDEQWSVLKKQANKHYKDLKNREYDLRHKRNV